MSASPIRVLYCIERMALGGTEKQLAALIRGVDRRRVEPALCALKPSTIDPRKLDCPVIELGFHTFRSPAALVCAHRLRQFIRHHGIDVVQTFFQDPTLLACLASMGTNVRARIATFRDMGFWRTPGKVAQLRLAYPHFDGFIANSYAVARRVHELDRIPLEKIAVIPNGVAFGPERPRAKNVVPVVGIVANLDRRVKRVDLFLQAARMVREAVGHVAFVVIGDGHLRPALEHDAARLGIADAVQFLGSIQNVSEQIRRFDVGVICSESEGLSNAILEYMAAGVPTVARDVGGNAEAVIDNETGSLVGDDRPETLSAAIVKMLRSDHQRWRMGEQARAVAEREFSLTACVRRHEEYYGRLITSPRELRPVWHSAH